GADQDGLQARLGDAEHRVQHDVQVGVADRVEVELADDRVEVPVDRGLLGDELAALHLVRGQGADIRRIEGGHVRGELVGDLELGVPPALGEDLQPVVQSRVVGGGDGDAVRGARLLHRPHAHRGGDGAGDDGDGHAV